MKKSQFIENQIVAILKKGETGMSVAGMCRKHDINNRTYSHKYSGVQEASELQRLRELEAENARLKHMYSGSGAGECSDQECF
ncbi:transposase [Nitrosomonas sp.]|uniref:transposase n=1 Tax=Nitrosomonas sp. TaxID=42353 RepID=UPI00330573D5